MEELQEDAPMVEEGLWGPASTGTTGLVSRGDGASLASMGRGGRDHRWFGGAVEGFVFIGIHRDIRIHRDTEIHQDIGIFQDTFDKLQ